jgi:hypothetical protein
LLGAVAVGAVENGIVQCANSMSAENELYIVANCNMENKNAFLARRRVKIRI